MNGEKKQSDFPNLGPEHRMPEIEVTGIAPAPKPWGFWPTIWLSIFIGLVALIAQIIFVAGRIAVILIRKGEIKPELFVLKGDFLLASILFSYPFVLGLMVLLIKLRRPISAADYLALRKINCKHAFFWIACQLALICLTSVISGIIQQQETPEFMEVATDETHPWLMLPTLILFAPVVEELFFRGFMFRGIAASRAGSTGAVILTTLFWVAIHGLQYDWFPLAYLTVFGILLGWSRYRTGSIITPLILHILNNAITTFPLVGSP